MGIWARIKQAVTSNPKKVWDKFLELINAMDWSFTWPRLWQVFSDVIANPTDNSNDNYNQDSSYNISIRTDTTFYGVVGATGAFLLFAVIREFYRSRHKDYLESETYLKEHLVGVGVSDLYAATLLNHLPETLFELSRHRYTLDEAARRDGRLVLQFAEGEQGENKRRAREQKLKKQKAHANLSRVDQEEAKQLNRELSQGLAHSEFDTHNQLLLDEDLHGGLVHPEVEEHEDLARLSKLKRMGIRPTYKLPWLLHKINVFGQTAPVRWIGYLYDKLSQASLIFWIVFSVCNIALGIATVASGAAIAAPWVLLAVTAIFAVYGIWKSIAIIKNSLFPAPDSEVTPASKATKKYLTRFFIAEDMQQVAKNLHQQQTELGLNVAAILAAAKKRATAEGRPFPSLLHSVKVKQPINEDDYSPKTIRERLIGTKAKRYPELVIGTFFGFIGGFIMTSFIGWFVGFVLQYLAATVGPLAFLVGPAAFMGGPWVLLVGGLIVGLVIAIKAFAAVKGEQRDFAAKVDGKLVKDYQGDTLEEGAEIARVTRLEKFAALQKEIAQATQKIDALVESAKASVATLYGDGLINSEEKKALLTKIDALQTGYLAMVNNANKNDYFEKWRHTVPVFTWIKKIFNRGYDFLGRSQSGVYLARALLLLSGAIPVIFGIVFPVVGFFIAAVVLAVVMGVCGVAMYQLRREKQHTESLVEDIDSRILYAEKCVEQLDLAKEALTNQTRQLQNLDLVEDVRRADYQYGSVFSRANEREDEAVPLQKRGKNRDSSQGSSDTENTSSDDEGESLLLPERIHYRTPT